MEKNKVQENGKSTRFAKGHAKTGGRKKGTPNRINSVAHCLLEDYVRGNRERVLADINSLNSKDRGRLIIALAKAKLGVFVLTGHEAVKSQRKRKQPSGGKGGVKE